MTVTVDGARIAIEPVAPNVAPIVLGEELKDLGAAVAVRVVRALGGAVEPDGERVVVTLPAAWRDEPQHRPHAERRPGGEERERPAPAERVLEERDQPDRRDGQREAERELERQRGPDVHLVGELGDDRRELRRVARRP